MEPFYKEVFETFQKSDLDFWDKLKAIFELHVDAAQEDPDLLRFLHAIAFSNLYTETFDFQAYWVKTLRTLAELFELAQVEGDLRHDRTPLFLARNFMGMVLSEVRSLVYSPEIVDHAISSEELVDLFRRGASK